MIKDRAYYIEQLRLYKDEKQITIAFIIIGVVLIWLISDVIYLNLVNIRNQTNQFMVVSPSRAVIPTSFSDSPSPLPTSVAFVHTVLTPIPTRVSQQDFSNQLVKDYFIPLGSGSTQANTWTDIPGAQASVDFGQYPNIKEILFETSVFVPSGNESVSVRLFNVTDQHPVWFSTVTVNSGNTSAYVTSSSLLYDTGLKVYQVQMATQLQAPADLVQARIHILLH